MKPIYPNIPTTMRNHEIQTESTEKRWLYITEFITTGNRSCTPIHLSTSSNMYKVYSRESGLTQSAKKLLAHIIFVSALLLLSDWGNFFLPKHVDIILSLTINTWNNLNPINISWLEYMYSIFCTVIGTGCLIFSFCSAWYWMLFLSIFLLFLTHVFNQNKTLRYNVTLL